MSYGYAGRRTLDLEDTVTYTSKYAEAVRIASVYIKYAEPVTLDITIRATLNGEEFLRTLLPLADSAVLAYSPAALWLRPEDTLTVESSVSTPAEVVIDLVYN